MVRRARQRTEDRINRKPIGPQLRCDFRHISEDDPQCNYRLVNNEMGRIQQFIRQGWEVVEGAAYQGVWRQDADTPSEEGTFVSVPVGVGRAEGAINAVLMKIDKKTFAENESWKREQLDAINRSLEMGKPKDLDTDGQMTYAPNLPTGGQGFEEIRNE